MDWKQRIDISTDLPRVRGTSVTVQAVVDAIAEGHSIEELQHRLPELSEEDIRACVACAADAMRRQIFARLVRDGLAEANAGLVVPDEDADSVFDDSDETEP